jgi:hypothetical protein
MDDAIRLGTIYKDLGQPWVAYLKTPAKAAALEQRGDRLEIGECWLRTSSSWFQSLLLLQMPPSSFIQHIHALH